MTVRGAAETYLSIAIGDVDSAREIVADNGTSQMVTAATDGNVSLVLRLSPTGVVTEVGRIEGQVGQVAVRDLAVAPSGTVVVVGFGSESTGTTIRTPSDAATITFVGGLGDALQGWAAAIDANGHVLWTRHFFAAPGAGAEDKDLTVIPNRVAVTDNDVWLALWSQRLTRSRTDASSGQLLVGSNEGDLPSRTTLVRLGLTTGDVVSAGVLGSKETFVSSMIADDGGPVVAGRTLELSVGGEVIGNGTVHRPFLVRPELWGRQVAESAQLGADFMTSAETAFVEPFLAKDGTGGYFVWGLFGAGALVGIDSIVGLTPIGSNGVTYLTRVGSNRWLDCYE